MCPPFYVFMKLSALPLIVQAMGHVKKECVSVITTGEDYPVITSVVKTNAQTMELVQMVLNFFFFAL